MPAILPALALVPSFAGLAPRTRANLLLVGFLVAAYLGLVLYDLVRGPLALKSMRASGAFAKRMILVGEGEMIPREFGPFLQQSRTALEGLGFRLLGVMRSDEIAGYVALFSDAAGMVATALIIKKGQVNSLIGLTTRLASGAMVRTSNTRSDSPWPSRAGDDVIRLPEPDLVRLHAMHKARVAKHVAKGARIAPIAITDPVAYQFEEERQSLERAVASGYFRREGTQKRHTWKGACLNAWRRSHPFKELRQWAIARAHRALLREIGAGV